MEDTYREIGAHFIAGMEFFPLVMWNRNQDTATEANDGPNNVKCSPIW